MILGKPGGGSQATSKRGEECPLQGRLRRRCVDLPEGKKPAVEQSQETAILGNFFAVVAATRMPIVDVTGCGKLLGADFVGFR